MSAQIVTIRVPGSTSNCGAGFDTLGLALTLYNQVTLIPQAPPLPHPAGSSDQAAQAMVEAAAAGFFQAAKVASHGFSYRIAGDVPTARGLGSSVTVRAGVVAGLNHLAGSPLSRQQLVGIVSALEGHPDNAAAAILGGFCVARCDPTTREYVDTIKIEVPADLAFVVASPRVEMLTKESRGVLPSSLPYFDAVKSINSATYLVAAFATRDYDRLRQAVADFMHEPYRLPRIPGGRAAIDAGLAAGALTGWLSGSGSSVLCVARTSEAEAVRAAMRASLETEQVFGEAFVLHADNAGLMVV